MHELETISGKSILPETKIKSTEIEKGKNGIIWESCTHKNNTKKCSLSRDIAADIEKKLLDNEKVGPFVSELHVFTDYIEITKNATGRTKSWKIRENGRVIGGLQTDIEEILTEN